MTIRQRGMKRGERREIKTFGDGRGAMSQSRRGVNGNKAKRERVKTTRNPRGEPRRATEGEEKHQNGDPEPSRLAVGEEKGEETERRRGKSEEGRSMSFSWRREGASGTCRPPQKNIISSSQLLFSPSPPPHLSCLLVPRVSPEV